VGRTPACTRCGSLNGVQTQDSHSDCSGRHVANDIFVNRSVQNSVAYMTLDLGCVHTRPCIEVQSQRTSPHHGGLTCRPIPRFAAFRIALARQCASRRYCSSCNRGSRFFAHGPDFLAHIVTSPRPTPSHGREAHDGVIAGRRVTVMHVARALRFP
jgi:hypothetical protein